MAKMFYTLEEAAEKLGKSQDEVRELAESGQLQEFRDRDKLMFKVDQVDLLSSDDGGDAADMSSMIPLADDELSGLGGGDASAGLDIEDDSDSESEASSGEDWSGGGESGALSLEDTASGGSGTDIEEPSLSDTGEPSGSGGPGGSGSGDSKGKSGVSIFDADELEEADPSAVTQVSGEGGGDDLALENVGSGSGLMDLTRESDDTSLGADAFLDDIMTEGEGSMAGEQPEPTSDLFEGGEAEAEPMAAAPAAGGAVMVERYDGPGSGLVGGLCFGAVIALAIGMLAVVTGMMGVSDGGVSSILADQFMIVVGALAALTLVAGVVGFVLGRRT